MNFCICMYKYSLRTKLMSFYHFKPFFSSLFCFISMKSVSIVLIESLDCLCNANNTNNTRTNKPKKTHRKIPLRINILSSRSVLSVMLKRSSFLITTYFTCFYILQKKKLCKPIWFPNRYKKIRRIQFKVGLCGRFGDEVQFIQKKREKKQFQQIKS